MKYFTTYRVKGHCLRQKKINDLENVDKEIQKKKKIRESTPRQLTTIAVETHRMKKKRELKIQKETKVKQIRGLKQRLENINGKERKKKERYREI